MHNLLIETKPRLPSVPAARRNVPEKRSRKLKKKKKKNPGIAVSARLRFFFFFPSSVSSSSGGPVCLTLERQQKTSSCYRPDVALWLATLLTQRTGILIGPIKSDPRPELCMSSWTCENQTAGHFSCTKQHNTTHLTQYHRRLLTVSLTLHLLWHIHIFSWRQAHFVETF